MKRTLAIALTAFAIILPAVATAETDDDEDDISYSIGMPNVPSTIVDRARQHIADIVGLDYERANYEFVRGSAIYNNHEIQPSGYDLSFRYRPLTRLGVDRLLGVFVPNAKALQPRGCVAHLESDGRIVEPAIDSDKALQIASRANKAEFDASTAHLIFRVPGAHRCGDAWSWSITSYVKGSVGSCRPQIRATVDSATGGLTWQPRRILCIAVH